MNDDLRQRISAALDAPGGLQADTALADELAQDPDAAAYVRDLERIDGALRGWQLPDRGDDAWEALATRIEQRLDERLVTLPDPTLAPSFEVADARHELALKAGPKPPRPAPAPYKIAEISALSTKDGDSQPAPAPAAVAPPPPPPPSKGPPTGKHATGAKSPPPPPAGATDRPAPPPPPAQKKPSVVPAARRAASSEPERFSLSDIMPSTGARGPAPDRFTLTEAVSAPGSEGLSSATHVSGERKRGARVVWIGGAALAAAAAIGLVVVVTSSVGREPSSLSGPPTAVQAVAEAEIPAGSPRTPGSAAAEPSEMAGMRAAPALPTAAPSVGAATAGAPPPAQPVPLDAARRPASSAARPRVSEHGARTGAAAGGSAVRETGSEPAAASVTTQDTTPRVRTPRPAPPSAADDANLPEAPDRDAVLNALSAVRPAVAACAEGRSGVATVQLTVANTGRVSGALVSGIFAGTPQGSCIARAVRQARFPRFTRPTFSVTFPFPL